MWEQFLPHSLLQTILAEHFRKHRKLGFGVLTECRTKITASRYRVPDLIQVPEPFERKARLYQGVPFAVIEILSPDDRMNVVMARFQEYEMLGVRFMIQMDPEWRVTHIYEHGDLLQRELTSLDGGERSIPFDTRALFTGLDA